MKSKLGLWVVVIACLGATTGCRKPFHEALMVDIGTSEAAILVETINDNGQAAIAPKGKGENVDKEGNLTDFYQSRLVNARKVEIPYYWKQTKRIGAMSWEHSGNGEWRPAARLIIIDMSPETREWTSNANSGTSNTNQGIWVESSDSVGFSTGISITARIANLEDAVKFLSNYPPEGNREVVTEGGAPFKVEVTGLAQIMDQEVRTKIQEVFAYEAAAFTMDELRDKKREILDTVQEEVIPFFKERGLTITSIGQFGGFTYENPDIQKAIDQVFEAQQDEEVAKAEAKAAEQRKEALKLKGEGEAQQQIEAAKGKAEGVKLEAEAEAAAIQAVADAKRYEIEQANQDLETYLKLKQLEIDMKKAELWDGKLPVTNFGGGESGGNFLFPLGKK
jgi:hypothetical protein